MYVIVGVVMFVARGNFTISAVGYVFIGFATLLVTYLTDIIILDCSLFNEWKYGKRMDGTMRAIKGLTGKLRTAPGSAFVGVLMGIIGYNGAIDVQSESSVWMIRALQGFVPTILFIIIGIMMCFYDLDKLMPDIRKSKENKLSNEL
jgi:GPH family glycoside/pentoside/hexuronide:cation symporter/probable glucitol transport protein GutA